MPQEYSHNMNKKNSDNSNLSLGSVVLEKLGYSFLACSNYLQHGLPLPFVLAGELCDEVHASHSQIIDNTNIRPIVFEHPVI